MKRKLLLAFCALLIGWSNASAAAADYLTGWTEVTSLPTNNSELDQYYYVFVATEADLMLAQEWGMSKLGDTQEGKLTMVYRTPANPLSHKTMVWMLSYDATYLYGIRNLNKSTHFMQSRGGAPWRVQFAWETAQSKWTRWNIAYASDSWTIENKACDNESTDTYFSNKYIGPWTEGAFADNNVVAGNKADDNVGKFKIYRMLRTTYNAKNVTSTYLTNASFETNPVLEDSYDNRTSSVSGWTFTKINDGTRFAIGTKTADDGHMGYVGSNVKPTDGDYYLSLRGRWHNNSSNEGGTVSQSITSLPKGKYTLTADYQLFINAAGKGSATFTLETNGGSYLNTQTGVVGTTASASVTNWNTHKPQTVSFDFDYMTGVTTFKLDFASTANAQILLDNVNLVYNSNYTDALESAIARATAMNTRKSSDALSSAIETAQGVLDSKTDLIAYQTTIDEAVTTLNTAIATAWSALKSELASGENITYLVENPGFEYSTPVSNGVVTTIGDAKANNTSFGMMQNVSGWEMAVENGNNHASGVFAYGGTPWVGGSGYTAPATDPSENSGQALGIVAVWTNTTQYKQDVTLPSGRYTITLPIYNKTGGTANFSKNLFGFIEDGGTEHLATATTYAVNSWTTETVTFDLNSETSGYLSLGYTATNAGSGSMPHLFVDGLTITYTNAANAYATTLAAATETYNDAAYVNVIGTEKTDLYNAINPATVPSTVEEYFAAVATINEAVSAFTAAKTNYDKLVAERVTGATYTTVEWPRASVAKKTALDNALAATAPTNATDAGTKANAIVTAYRQFVESNGTAEGVSGAVDFATTIAGADPNVNTGWTDGVGVDDRAQEKYTDGSGNTSGKYYDGGWSTSAGANINMTREITLPAGTYQLQVTARGSSSLTSYTMSIGGETVDLPKEGSGADAGTFGHGWSDKFIVFTSDGSPLTLTIAATSTDYYQWISFNRFRLINLADATVPVEITAAGYATFSSAYPLDLIPANTPSGLEAYYVGSEGVKDTYVSLTRIEQTVAANEGILFKGAPGETYNVPVAVSGDALEGNQLVAADGSEVAAGNFVFAYENGTFANPGFYTLTAGTVIAAGKAYLQKPVSGVKAFLPFDGTATGVEAPEATEAEEEEILYNTAGVRVDKNYKGIVINQKGEKFLNK